MALTLTIRTHADRRIESIRSSVTFDQPRVVLGRSESCDLRIPDPSISQRHAIVEQQGTGYVVVDEASSNGTVIGTSKLYPRTPHPVTSGDFIRLGRVWIEVTIEAALPTPHASLATKDLALAIVAESLGHAGQDLKPRLRIVEGPDCGKGILVPENGRPVILGRGREVDLCLENPDASRRHTRIEKRGEMLMLRDLGSRNGTLVQGRPIPIDRDTPIRAGESFEIANDVILFVYPAAEALRRVEALQEDEVLDDRSNEPPPVAATTHAHGPVPVIPPEFDDSPQVEEESAKSESPEPRPARPAPRKPQGGWGTTDVFIVLLALAVLAASGVGLYWLFLGS